MTNESKIKEKPCWLCPDYIGERCTQYYLVIRAGRPCGQQFLKALQKLNARPNPFQEWHDYQALPWYKKLWKKLAIGGKP